MALRRKRFWLPIMGLGSLFVAVVLAGNALMGVVYKAPQGLSESRSPSDYLERKVRKVRRVFQLIRGRKVDPPAPQSRISAGEPFAFDILPEPVLASSETARATAEPRRLVLPEPVAKVSKTPLLLLNEPLAGPSRWSRLRLSLLDEVRSDMSSRASHQQLMEDWSVWYSSSGGPFERALNDVFVVPTSLCDGVLDLVRGCFPPAGCYSLLQEDERSMVERLVQLQDFERERSPFTAFVLQWLDKEQKFFGGSGDYLLTMGVEEGLEPIDQEDFAYEQGKILLDVARKSYLMRYLSPADDRLKNEAWHISEWKPLDFVAVPPMLAAYTWYRGWERRFRVLGTRVHVKMEPPSRIRHKYGRGDDLACALGMEVEIPGLPVSIIASAGLNDGEFGMDFIGIGTSLGEAKKAIKQLMAEDDEDLP